jgi:small subunit ribosomal protein S6
MRNYEVTFIVDPVLSGDELKATADKYIKIITDAGGEIVFINELGLRPLAYQINKRASGTYYCVEFATENVAFITKMELSMRRDDNLLRFLTVALDKFGVKYNEDRRAGKIGSAKKKADKNKKKKDKPKGPNSTTGATDAEVENEAVVDAVAAE